MSNLATTSSTSETLPAPWVERLFSRLNDALGGKMADLYVGRVREDVEREWSIGLAGMTGRELARGVKAARLRTFAPNVGEFARLCRPALDPEYAFREAQIGLAARSRGETGEWSHPAVYRAAMTLSWDVRRKSYREMRYDWDRELTKEFERGWGEDVPPAQKQVEHSPTNTVQSPAVRARVTELLKTWGARKS